MSCACGDLARAKEETRVDGHDMGHHRNTINSEIFFIFFALHNLLCKVIGQSHRGCLLEVLTCHQ